MKNPNNTFIKKIISLIYFLLFALVTHAQVPANTQKMIEEAKAKMKALQSNPGIAQKMKMAQHILDSLKSDTKLKKQMQAQNTMLDSLKKTHPELAGIQMPDLNKMNAQLPNFDSIGKTLDNTSDKLRELTESVNQTVPKQNLFHHADKLPKFSESTFVLLAQALLKKAKPALDPIQIKNLNTILKDTSINITDLGANFLALGFSKNAAVFLICHSILKNPKNPWAANNLGVFFRTQMNYEKALQCFFYANSVDAKEAAINTNIGWASAYYGDFIISKKYFEKALAIHDNFRSALEGEANVAFAEGDIAALFQCLAKEVKYVGGSGKGGGGGPSPAFASLCGGTTAINQGNLDHQTSDPTNDHTFDNPNPDGSHSSDAPPGGQVDDIQYKNFSKVFEVSDAKQITNAIEEAVKPLKQFLTELKNRSNALTVQLRSLKPLVQRVHLDGKYLVYPASFKSYVEMLTPIAISFDKRMAWWETKLEKKLEPFRKQMVPRDMDMMKGYLDAIMGCGNSEECIATVNCTWLPKMHKSKNADLEFGIKIWNEYYENVSKAIQWYIDASAPFIYKVQDDEWNKYLNAYREFLVRKAIIKAYGLWYGVLGNITTPILGYLNIPVPPCPAVKMFAGIKAPNPYSKKPHHIYEFKDPNCYHIKFPFPGGTDELTCHGERVTYGIKTPDGSPIDVNIGGFSEVFTDPLKASDLGYDKKTGFGVGASISIGKVGLSGEDKVESTYYKGHLMSSTFTENAKLSVYDKTLVGVENVETIAGSNISNKTTVLGPTSNYSPPQKDDLDN